MKILYLCTHNRCRSILSEAITNHFSEGKIQAFSAGSQPEREVHPLSLKYLAEKGISTQGLQSQSWNEFEAEQPDIIVTLCNSAAAECCPQWFDNTLEVHWGLTDPSKLHSSEAEVRAAFYAVIGIIEQCVKNLLSLNFDNLSLTERRLALNTLAI